MGEYHVILKEATIWELCFSTWLFFNLLILGWQTSKIDDYVLANLSEEMMDSPNEDSMAPTAPNSLTEHSTPTATAPENSVPTASSTGDMTDHEDSIQNTHEDDLKFMKDSMALLKTSTNEDDIIVSIIQSFI